MSWRPEKDWKNPADDMANMGDSSAIEFANGYEAGADAMLMELQPLLSQVYAQLCGLRLAEGKTDYYSSLDESIDKLKPIIIPEEAE